MEKEERRRFKRVDLHTPVRYQIRGSPEFHNTVSEDISAGGLAFNALDFISPETPLMLQINLLSRVMHPIGMVSWCHPLPHSHKNRIGIEFLEFDSFERKHLTDYINMKTGSF